MADAHGGVDVKWSPGHTGIPGNLRANKHVKDGLDDDACSFAMTLARVRRHARAASREQFASWFRRVRPRRYVSHFDTFDPATPREPGEKPPEFVAELKCPSNLKHLQQSSAR